MANNAKIIDVNTIIAAGINPKTGLPIRMGDGGTVKPELKEDIRRALRIVDEQDAINRYAWYNLPSGINGQMLERILYYKGQAAFFYMPTDETFYFLPYALDGTIDVYGRFTGITPLPFNGTAKDKKDAWIVGLTRKPVYDVVLDASENDPEDLCVLLSDYSNQLSQINISRQILQEPILDTISEAFPLARTALMASSGIRGVRVPDEDAQSNVKEASRSITRAALTGDIWIPILSSLEMQDLTSGTTVRSEEYLLYMQALDNFRLSLLGLDNGGLFQKKAQVLQAEQQANGGSNTGLIYQDGLTLRQRFCDIVNSIWGLGIWCEPSETQTNMDMNGDGMVFDSQDQSGMPGEQPAMPAGGEE